MFFYETLQIIGAEIIGAEIIGAELKGGIKMKSTELNFIKNMANDRIKEKQEELKRLKLRLELYKEMNKDTEWIKERIKSVEQYIKIAMA